jgi:hypothetical protein
VFDDSRRGEVVSSFRGYRPDVGCPWVRGEGEGLLVCVLGRVVITLVLSVRLAVGEWWLELAVVSCGPVPVEIRE